MSGDGETAHHVPESVLLTIRCAFQTIEDQTVEASTSWSVRQLKEQIRDSHPSHPEITTMKLIYGGHCLQDNRVLKTIFEQVPPVLDGPTVFHLVGPIPRTEPQLRQRTAAATSPNLQTTTPPTYQQVFQNLGNYTSAGAAPTLTTTQDYIEYYRNYVNYCRFQQQMIASQMQGAFQNPFPHAVYVNNGMGVPIMPYFVNPGQVQPVNLTGGNNHRIVVNAVIQPPQAPQQPLVQAPERGMNDMIGDGLDLFYKCIRILFVLSAVLLYSTFERFLLVISIVLVIMFTQYRRAENRRAAANAQPVNNNNAGEQQQAENRPADENVDEAQVQGEDSVPTEGVVPAPSPVNFQTVCSAVYSFVTSFIASLVPDHIPVDVN